VAVADESLNFRAFGTDVSAGRMFGDLGDKADDAGDSIHGLGDESKDLDTRLDETRKHLRALIDDFDRTGDTSLFRDIRRDRSTISMIESMRKELRGIGEDGDDVGRRFGTNVSRGLSDSLGALPSQLKGTAIAALVGIGAVAAPALGAAIAGAVVGGVGLGGIVGGVALAAQDPRVHDAGVALGKNLLGDLKGAATPFIQPLLDSFSELEETGASFTATLHDGFSKLAPLIGPLTKGIDGFVDALGPGLADVFTAAQPAIRALANELPEIGEALSDMLSTISEDDRATEGLIGLLHATEFLITATGDFIGFLEWEYDWLVRIGTKLDEFKEGPLGFLAANFGFVFNALSDEATNVADATDKAKDSTDDWDTSLRDLMDSTKANTQALQDWAAEMEAAADPTFNLIHRLREVKDAQHDYNEAVKENGRNSPAAKEANLRLAEAILAANSAAAKASGTLDGRLDPALRATLKAAGMSEAQLYDLEKAARAARRELDKYEGVYTAQVRLEFTEYRKGERELSRRAAGGPVMSGNTYWVGEQGPELVTFGASGTVIPHQRSMAMAAGAPAGAVSVSLSIDPSGARDELAALFLKMLRVNSGFRDAVSSYVGAAT
jgi:ABC-type transporter Mla subunit MlaD